MKKILMVSILFSLIISTAAYAETEYAQTNETQNSSSQVDLSSRADANRSAWNQTIRSYEVNYNESYTRNWDKYTDAYQKSKKIQH